MDLDSHAYVLHTEPGISMGQMLMFRGAVRWASVADTTQLSSKCVLFIFGEGGWDPRGLPSMAVEGPGRPDLRARRPRPPVSPSPRLRRELMALQTLQPEDMGERCVTNYLHLQELFETMALAPEKVHDAAWKAEVLHMMHTQASRGHAWGLFVCWKDEGGASWAHHEQWLGFAEPDLGPHTRPNSPQRRAMYSVARGMPGKLKAILDVVRRRLGENNQDRIDLWRRGIVRLAWEVFDEWYGGPEQRRGLSPFPAEPAQALSGTAAFPLCG